MTVGFSDGSRNFVNSFPSPEKFLFCAEKIESIEWQDLVPLLRIGDCFGFTTFTENFVICCNEITKIFCTKYGSASASSARGACHLGFPCILRNFELFGSEYKYTASLIPLSLDVPNLTHAIFFGCCLWQIFEIFCELLQPLRKI